MFKSVNIFERPFTLISNGVTRLNLNKEIFNARNFAEKNKGQIIDVRIHRKNIKGIGTLDMAGGKMEIVEYSNYMENIKHGIIHLED